VQGLTDVFGDPVWLAAYATVALVVVGVVTVLVMVVGLRRGTKQPEHRPHPQLDVHRTSELNPNRFVGAYDAADFHGYLATAVDEQLKDVLRREHDVILIGRPGSGKSHTAVHHITNFVLSRWFRAWYVIVLDKINFTDFINLRLVGVAMYFFWMTSKSILATWILESVSWTLLILYGHSP
jgi:hypothetical protein